MEETWSSRWDNRDSAEAYTNPMRSPPTQSTRSSQKTFDPTLTATRSHTSTRFGGLSSWFGGSTRSTKSSGPDGKKGSSSAGVEMEIPTWITSNGEEKDTSEQGAGEAVAATVAAAVAAAGGDEDWEVLTDEDGNTYYHNKKTGDTSWEDPRKASGKDMGEDAGEDAAGEMATAGESQPQQTYGAIRNPSGASNRRRSTLTVVPEGAAAAAPMAGVGEEGAGRMGGAGGGGNSCRTVSREVSSASSDEAHL